METRWTLVIIDKEQFIEWNQDSLTINNNGQVVLELEHWTVNAIGTMHHGLMTVNICKEE